MKAFLGILLASSTMVHAHSGFVSLEEVCPGIIVQANYASTQNFTGEIVPGYKAPKAFMAESSARVLCQVQKEAKKLGYELKIFDSYRPTKAVLFFMEWAQRPETNPDLKQQYYPKFTRQELFDNGYIAKQSSHSRGSAVDLTLVSLKTKKQIDMGTDFDFFGELSHTDSDRVTKTQQKNRMILKDLMENEGFKNFGQEWWHFSFKPEQFPDQYFDFDIE